MRGGRQFSRAALADRGVGRSAGASRRGEVDVDVAGGEAGLELTPDLAVPNGLKAEWVCSSPAVVKAYVADPLVHDRISGRLSHFLLDAGAVTGEQSQGPADVAGDVAPDPLWRCPVAGAMGGKDQGLTGATEWRLIRVGV